MVPGEGSQKGRDMNLRHLETFVAVAEKGSFSKAAQVFYTTPTALTQQVNALERELGLQLLARVYRGASLTEAGSVYLGYARDIINLEHTAEREARAVAGLGRPRINVGSYRNVELVLLKDALAGFARLRPDVDVSFVDGNYRDFLNQLESGDIDLYVQPFYSGLDRSDIGFQRIGTTGISCSMAIDHPLACRKSLTVGDLAECDVIVSCGCGLHVFDGLGQRLQSREPNIRIWQFATDSEVWTHVLTQGFILMNMSYSAPLLGSSVAVPIDWPETFEYGYVYRAPCSGVVRGFLDYAAGHQQI